MNKPPDKESDYRTIKLSLKQVAKDECIIKLTEVVTRMNAIWRRSFFVLKSYLLDDPIRCDKIDEDFLDLLMQSVCKQSNKGRKATKNKDQKEELTEFYKSFCNKFPPNSLPTLHYTHLNTVLDYTAVSWFTAITNNIQVNYVNYVEAYVNHCFNKSNFIEDVKADISLDQKTKDAKKRAF